MYEMLFEILSFDKISYNGRLFDEMLFVEMVFDEKSLEKISFEEASLEQKCVGLKVYFADNESVRRGKSLSYLLTYLLHLSILMRKGSSVTRRLYY